jgi:Uma2 family endonuclease
MAAPAYHDPSIDEILELHDHFDPPAGHTAEVIGGQLVLSATPVGRHGLIFTRLLRQLTPLLPTGMEATNNITLQMPATRERYIPDLVVMAYATLDSDDWLFEADDAELVVEIVSPSNARDDRVTKVGGYAASGVPIYRLVDPLDKIVTLFETPEGESYRHRRRAPFGETLMLPEPFDGPLDTALLLR